MTIETHILFGIIAGSRFKPTHDFGYVALDIAGLRPEDEGIYSCRARNDLGEAVTTASVRIRCEYRCVQRHVLTGGRR